MLGGRQSEPSLLILLCDIPAMAVDARQASQTTGSQYLYGCRLHVCILQT